MLLQFEIDYIHPRTRILLLDFHVTWPAAEIAVMGAEGAANIIHRREIKEASDPTAKRQEKIDEYREELNKIDEFEALEWVK